MSTLWHALPASDQEIYNQRALVLGDEGEADKAHILAHLEKERLRIEERLQQEDALSRERLLFSSCASFAAPLLSLFKFLSRKWY